MIFVAVFVLSLLFKTATADCEGNSCCFNRDCGGSTPFCAGGAGTGCKCRNQFFASMHHYGSCVARYPDGQRAYNDDYQSCIHRNGVCGTCGPTVRDGLRCSTNSDCSSGWCNGQYTTGCNGYCSSLAADGGRAFSNDVGGWDYNSCSSGHGQCGVCGSSNPTGHSCSTHSDCSSGFCNGVSSVLCRNTCQDKIPDNGACPRTITNDGMNEACRSGECMEMLKFRAWDTISLCRPHGGFVSGPCTLDADCSDAGRGYWCNGGGVNSLGHCETCPDTCSGGCHACGNDVTRMNCGRSDTWDKIGCAAEIIASEALEFLECMTGVDAGCVRAIAGEAIDCVGGECIFEIGEECLSFERDFEFNMEMLENYENIDVTLSGNMNLHVGMDLTLNLKEWEFTLTATSTISHSLEVDVVSSAEHVYEEEKALTRPYQLFRKVFFVYGVPVLVEADVTPMAWFNFETKASFEANLLLSGRIQHEQTFMVDIDDRLVDASLVALEDNRPIGIDNLSATGHFTANAVMRVGPRIEFSIYKIPVSLDIAARIGASTDLTASYSTWGHSCVAGSAQLNAGIDIRVGTSFPSFDPSEFVLEACQEATGVLMEAANPVNAAIDATQCFTDILGIDTSVIDDQQEELTESVQEFMGSACNAAVAFLVPSPIQHFSCVLEAAASASTDWTSLMSIEASISAGLCWGASVSQLDAELSGTIGTIDVCAAAKTSKLNQIAIEG